MVGAPVALVRDAVALIGDVVTVISGPLALVSETVALGQVGLGGLQCLLGGLVGPGRPGDRVGRPGRPPGRPRRACDWSPEPWPGVAGRPHPGRCPGWRPAPLWPARSRPGWSAPDAAGQPPAPGW